MEKFLSVRAARTFDPAPLLFVFSIIISVSVAVPDHGGEVVMVETSLTSEQQFAQQFAHNILRRPAVTATANVLYVRTYM